MKKQKSSRHKKRVLGLQAVFLIALGAVALRVQVVQHVFGPSLLAQARQTQTVTEPLLAPRGEILDAQGQPLAYDIPAYMMDVKVSGFTDRTQLANMIAKALGVQTSDAASLVDNANLKGWIRFPNPVKEPAKEQIQKALHDLYASAKNAAKQNGSNQLNVPNYPSFITFTPTEERVYPFGQFAANAVGYVDHKGVGESGLEEEYNKQLSGQNGEISYTVDGAGFPIQSTVKVLKPAQPGENIQTTIDGTIQGFVEQQMDALVKKYKPQDAAIIVADPNTGAILGMSSRPTYDPNQYWKANAQALNTNWAVQSSFEPGSTFKVITLAAGLATGAVNLNQTVMSGHVQVGPNTIWDWKRSGWGRITFRQALEYSSNVGFATVALRVGWPNMIHYMQAFGYLNKTGIDLPAEASSNVFTPSSRGKIELATSGFGQGIAVTPMQQIQGVGAIANGGKLMKPYVASKFIDAATGTVIKQVKPTVVNSQVVPLDVAQQVSHVMVLDVSNGIDSVGMLPGYDLAGKTGTAQVVNPKTGQYYTDRYITSFIGYAPGWDPKYEVYVTVNWPKAPVDQTWGSTVATPPARDLLKACLEYGHIAPHGSTGKTSPSPYAGKQTYILVPALTGQSSQGAAEKLKKAGFQPVDIGGTGNVAEQWPAAGTHVTAGSSIFFTGSLSTGAGKMKMPDLKGVPMREAASILSALGIDVILNGNGYVSQQSLKAGTVVQSGSTVTLTLAEQKPLDPVTGNSPSGG